MLLTVLTILPIIIIISMMIFMLRRAQRNDKKPSDSGRYASIAPGIVFILGGIIELSNHRISPFIAAASFTIGGLMIGLYLANAIKSKNHPKGR